MALELATSDAGFINSGDNKIVLKGQVPTVSVGEEQHRADPLVGSLTFASDVILASFTVNPSTGALVFASDQSAAHAPLTSAGSVVVSGIAPDAVLDAPITVPAGSLAIVGQQANRGVGLFFVGDTPSVQISHGRMVPAGAAVLSSTAPAVVITSADSHVAAPEVRSLVLGVPAPTLDTGLPAGSPAAIDFAGIAPSAEIDKPIQPASGTVSIASELVVVDPPPIIVIGLGPNDGTFILNATATTDTPNRYEICDRSGFKAKPGELVKTWDNLWVLPEFWEPRNLQDFVRNKAEQQRGATRPEPVGNETFIEDAYPDGVDADDL